MDPSLSISGDPHQHHPPQFTPFAPFSGAVAAPNHVPFGGPNPYMNNNHLFQPQPQVPEPPVIQASSHPSYNEMICAAIAALNEPDGSSKLAISRHIERSYTGLPQAHGAMLAHHLKSLKDSGVLTLVKKSYKFAVSSAPPESVAVVAAAAAQGVDVPRSDDPMAFSGSSSQPQKRGRGRPPKPKPEPQPQQQQQLINVQPIQVQTNGQPIWEQQKVETPVTKPTEEGTVTATDSVKRGRGRPRKNGASPAPIVQASSVMAGILKRRGRPPGRRAAGRQRKPKSVSSTASVYPYIANGARRRGRPRRVIDPNSIIVAAPENAGSVVTALAPGIKRGRGRPPKIGGAKLGGVISRLMKPKRGRGRPVGRPRKIGTSVTTGRQDSAELQRKFDIYQEKVKEIVKVLKAGVTSDNQEVMQAIQDLEGLTVIETVESQAMEEVQPEETSEPPNEAETETQGGQEEGEERGGEAQNKTEAEAMQEALF